MKPKRVKLASVTASSWEPITLPVESIGVRVDRWLADRPVVESNADRGIVSIGYVDAVMVDDESPTWHDTLVAITLVGRHA